MRNIEPILGLIIIFSCACGLIYEVIWTRQLTLFFGSPVFAVSTVLSALVGGLGTWQLLLQAFSKWRKASLLRLYAFLGAGLGIFALIFPDLVGYSQRYLCPHLSRTGCGVLFPFVDSVCSVICRPVDSVNADGSGQFSFSVDPPRKDVQDSERIVVFTINMLGASIGCIAAGFFLLQLSRSSEFGLFGCRD